MTGRAEFGRAWPAMHDGFEAMFDGIDDAEYAALDRHAAEDAAQHPQARHLTDVAVGNGRRETRRRTSNG